MKEKYVMRECKVHGYTEYILTFRSKLDRRTYYRCRACRYSTAQGQRKQRKQLLVDEGGGKCMACGYNYCISALQFHHLDPSTKKFNFSSARYNVSLDSLREEAKKCVVLCANCHCEVEAGVLDLNI